MFHYIKYLLGLTPYRYAIGDHVIFVNIFGVVYLWVIEEQTTFTKYNGDVVPAYLHKDTQTPWFPTEERLLRPASLKDCRSTPEELQKRYGFTPTEWFGCY